MTNQIRDFIFGVDTLSRKSQNRCIPPRILHGKLHGGISSHPFNSNPVITQSIWHNSHICTICWINRDNLYSIWIGYDAITKIKS